jgi:hypothetical protein
MDYEQAQAEAFRDCVSRGMTTAEAVRARYRERSLDTPEGSHRAQMMPTEAEPPTEVEILDVRVKDDRGRRVKSDHGHDLV